MNNVELTKYHQGIPYSLQQSTPHETAVFPPPDLKSGLLMWLKHCCGLRTFNCVVFFFKKCDVENENLKKLRNSNLEKQNLSFIFQGNVGYLLHFSVFNQINNFKNKHHCGN